MMLHASLSSHSHPMSIVRYMESIRKINRCTVHKLDLNFEFNCHLTCTKRARAMKKRPAARRLPLGGLIDRAANRKQTRERMMITIRRVIMIDALYESRLNASLSPSVKSRYWPHLRFLGLCELHSSMKRSCVLVTRIVR